MSNVLSAGRAVDAGRAARTQPAGSDASTQPIAMGPARQAGACACGGDCPRCKPPEAATTALAIQRKPLLSSHEEASEREADAVADQVLRMAEPAVADGSRPPSSDARTAPTQPTERASTALLADPGAATAVHAAARGGSPLPPALRAWFEPRFGRDLGTVRVHADGAAADAARGVQARAYTSGSDIVFGAGQFAPATVQGRRLLAHELAHVVQQGAAGARPASAPPVALEHAPTAAIAREEAAPAAGAPAPGGTGYDKARLLAVMSAGQDAVQAITLVAADPTTALDDLYAQSQYAPFWNLVEKSAPHEGATKSALKTIFETYRGKESDRWSVKRRLIETQFGITVWRAGDPANVDDVSELDALYAAACSLDAAAVKDPGFVAAHRKPAAAQAAPPAKFNDVYGGQNPNTATGNGSGGVLNAEQYRDKINTPGGPELKPASEYQSATGRKGTKSAFRLTKDELLEIAVAGQGKTAMDYLLSQGASADGKANRAHAEEALAQYMTYCQAAFETMMIDTIEAQALFIAHAAGETIFAKLTEGQTNNTFFESDPAKATVSTSTKSSTGEKYGDGVDIMNGPMRYGQKENSYNQAIDPTHAIDGRDPHSFDKTFIGRGPIQVTLKENYVQTLATMERRAIDLRAEANASGTPDPHKIEQARQLEAAVAAIRTEPRNAADPKYAFLFSAAFMQMGPMARSSAGGFTNSGMTGGYADRQGDKKAKAYDKAVEILKKHKAEDDAKAKAPP